MAAHPYDAPYDIVKLAGACDGFVKEMHGRAVHASANSMIGCKAKLSY
jgi:hypothetical protein